MQCPKCKSPMAAGSRFCGRCGQRIESGNDGGGAAAAPQQPAMMTVTPVAATAGAAAAADIPASAPSAPGPVAASTARLLERVKNMMLQPSAEWQVVAPEPTSIGQLYSGYVMPLAAFAALLSFVHIAVIGVEVPFAGVTRLPLASGVTTALLTFGMSLLVVLLVGLIINALAPTFAGTPDRRQALKVAAYSFTTAWLSSVLSLSPVLPTLLQLVALCYGIYVLYLGLPVLMRAPRERALGYTATVIVCTLLLGVLFMIISIVAGHAGLGTGRFASSSLDQAAARDQGAATVGNIIGNALGTDDKGKAGLTTALSNLVKAGESGAAQNSGAPASTSASAQGNAPAADAAAQSPGGAVGGLVAALGGALGGDHPVAAVDFKTLTALLPASLPGMTRTSAQGDNQGAVGVRVTSAKADYQGDNGAAVHVDITDMSGVSGLMGLAGTLVQTSTSQSDNGYERDQVIAGRTVHEKYDTKARKGDLSVILAKRFEVDVSGDGVDMSTLEQSLGQVDLARLESMKDQGAHAQ
jgi:Yip1 domain